MQPPTSSHKRTRDSSLPPPAGEHKVDASVARKKPKIKTNGKDYSACLDAAFDVAVTEWTKTSEQAVRKQWIAKCRQRILDTAAATMRDLPTHRSIPDLLRTQLDALYCAIEADRDEAQMDEHNAKMERLNAEVDRIAAVVAQDAKIAQMMQGIGQKIIEAQQSETNRLIKEILTVDAPAAAGVVGPKLVRLLDLTRRMTARNLAACTYAEHMALAEKV
jgi:hypothetical protein